MDLFIIARFHARPELWFSAIPGFAAAVEEQIGWDSVVAIAVTVAAIAIFIFIAVSFFPEPPP